MQKSSILFLPLYFGLLYGVGMIFILLFIWLYHHEKYVITSNSKPISCNPLDVPVTYAASEALERDYGFNPKIDI